VRNPGKVYPVSEDICEIDVNAEAEQYNYDGRLVYRGNLDTTQSTDDVKAYWLYDESSKRVGIVEHLGEEHTCLWFHDTPFGTLLQEEWEALPRTIWSLMTQAAYEDCMKHGWTTIDAISKRTYLAIVTPQHIIDGRIAVERCTRCLGTKQKGCLITKPFYVFDVYSTMFVDDDGVLYTPPEDSAVYATLRRRAGLASPPPPPPPDAAAAATGIGTGA